MLKGNEIISIILKGYGIILKGSGIIGIILKWHGNIGIILKGYCIIDSDIDVADGSDIAG